MFLHILKIDINRIMKLHFLLLAFISMTSYAQFTVGKSTTLSMLNGKLVSLEPTNTFASSIQGHGVFILNGQQQELFTSKNVFLQNLLITNASEFVAITPIYLKGSLTIMSGVLKLQHAIFIADNLYVDSAATVLDYSFIDVSSSKFKRLDALWVNAQDFSIKYIKKVAQYYITEITESKQKAICNVAFLASQHHIAPLERPPEAVL